MSKLSSPSLGPDISPISWTTVPPLLWMLQKSGFQPVDMGRISQFCLHKMLGKSKTYSPKWWFDGDLP